MTDLEWKILDELYLMNAYRSVFDAVRENASAFDAALVGLLQKGWLRQLRYDERAKDFVDVDPFDSSSLDNSNFVITRQGLLEHTGAA